MAVGLQSDGPPYWPDFRRLQEKWYFLRATRYHILWACQQRLFASGRASTIRRICRSLTGSSPTRRPVSASCSVCAGPTGSCARPVATLGLLGALRAGPLCTNCRRRASVTAGTIFEGTRKPLKLWFITAGDRGSQVRGERGQREAHARRQQLQNGVVVAAQVAARDGSSGSRSSPWRCRGRRDVCGRRGGGGSGASHGEEGHRGCGRGSR